jgi:hypothetical protein
VAGDAVRDWNIKPEIEALFPYGADLSASISDPILHRILWATRSVLALRREPGGTHAEIGLTWFEWSRWHPERFSVPLGIGMTEVATHNHFALDQGGRVFKQTAPVIKLPEGATEDDHLRLLGVLNSSTACFWLKQVSQAKTGADNSSGGGNRWSPEAWYSFYAFTGTKLQAFPLPPVYPLELSRALDSFAQRLANIAPAAIVASGLPTRKRLQNARAEWEATRRRMVAIQEELDWEVYQIYGLIEVELVAADAPELQPGQRAFEIVLARRMASGQAATQWFKHHGLDPSTEVPGDWPDEYRKVVERRIAEIESNRNINLLERPECKRRWSTPGWDVMQKEALQAWLLDRLEAPELWAGAPTPLSVAQLADRVRHDEDLRSILDLWVGSDQHDLVKTLGKLIADEHVPYLPPLRYKPAGLLKRVQWERTWDLQRQEDGGKTVKIDVPPKYASGDFLKASYWRNRGKLDVPKERFVSYPNMGRDGDPSLLLGWAGWDHLAQAQAIATVYLDRKNVAGWKKDDGLLSLLAGLAELEPWLRQWFDEPRAGFPGSPAQFFTGFVDTELATLGADRTDLDKLRFESIVR